MIRFFRNMAVRLWLSALMGIPISFQIITSMTDFISGYWPLVWSILVVAFFYAFIGVVMNRGGEYWVRGLIREAETWERGGILKRSEKNYKAALRVFDSFLFSPFGVRALENRITGAVAGFALSFAKSGHPFDQSINLFIRHNPQEKDIVQVWLARLEKKSRFTPEEQALLTQMADYYGDDPEMLLPLTQLFADQARGDLAAKKLYEKVLDLGNLDSNFEMVLQALLVQEGVGFFEKSPGFRQASREKIRVLWGAFIYKISKFGYLFVHAIIVIWTILKKCSLAMARFIYGIVKGLGKTPQNRQILKWGVASLLSISLIVVLGSTVFHLSQIKKAPPGHAKIEVRIPLPFTIQVAAYLKKSHADSYVVALKKKGQEAFIHQVDGGGKTWFFVRISSFKDKAEAGNYGRKLKAQGIIEDFFVDNSGSD